MANPDMINAGMTDAALAGLVAETAGKILLQIRDSTVFDVRSMAHVSCKP